MADHTLSSPVSSATLAKASSTPLPETDGASLKEPQPHFLESRAPSSLQGTNEPESAMGDSTAALGKKEASSSVGEDPEAAGASTDKKKKRTMLLLLAALAALAVIIIAVVVPVYFKVIKKKDSDSATPAGSHSGGSSSHSSGAPTPTTSAAPSFPTSGGDGSTVRLANGTTFTYRNAFGGTWYADPNDPYNDSARPNSWTPPLNEPFDYATTRIYGVNLGGLFVLEPFISPALFQKYPGAVDEWDLSVAMAADTAEGGLNQLEEHYKTFITEQDIANIAGAGLNYIRLPIGFWAIETWPGEPFLEGVSFTYFTQILQWCRKYGIRVNVDLHAVPGSANAYNHGGKAGQFNFLNGPMGLANAQRALNYIRIFTEFFAQPQWKNVVTMFSILNEPLQTTIGEATLRSFYVEAHRIMREITGYGAGNGPYMVLHDSFQGLAGLQGFTGGGDRIGADVHPYFCFGGAVTVDPIDTGVGAGAGGAWPQTACGRFGAMMNDSRNNFGVTVAGEFSNAFLDCGLFLHGVRGQASYGGGCEQWDDSSNWTPGIKAGIQAFAEAQMDGLGDWFFWTWKIGHSIRGIVEAPLWSYSLGLENGWMPTDPRTTAGKCAAAGVFTGTFNGFAPHMVGGAGAGAPAGAAQYTWPPAAFAGALAYSETGPVQRLPEPVYTGTNGQVVSVGDGSTSDSAVANAPVEDPAVVYPDAWAGGA